MANFLMSQVHHKDLTYLNVTLATSVTQIVTWFRHRPLDRFWKCLSACPQNEFLKTALAPVHFHCKLPHGCFVQNTCLLRLLAIAIHLSRSQRAKSLHAALLTLHWEVPVLNLKKSTGKPQEILLRLSQNGEDGKGEDGEAALGSLEINKITALSAAPLLQPSSCPRITLQGDPTNRSRSQDSATPCRNFTNEVSTSQVESTSSRSLKI